MERWHELVNESLKALGADETYVLGTKLHVQLERLASHEGLSLREALAGQSFSAFLLNVPGVEMIKTPGRDMLVGFSETPRPTEQIEGARRRSADFHIFRKDVYEALTRVKPTPSYYVPSRDAFADQADASDAIPLPLVTTESLKDVRTSFAELVEDPAVKQELLQVLSTSPNFLSDFQRVLVRFGLTRRWHEFNYQAVKAKLESWAKDHGLQPRLGWYTQSREDEISTWEVMTTLVRNMTPEELRALSVPFRAVEAMYRALMEGPDKGR